MENNTSTILFDLDGLLLDTERITMGLFIEACNAFGYYPEADLYYRCLGGSRDNAKRIMLEHYDPDFPWEDMYTVFAERHAEEVLNKPLPVKPGVKDFLDWLKSLSVQKAIVTSSRTDRAWKKLANAGLENEFELVFGGDRVEHPKPAPDIYLHACRELHIEPSGCLALEDSDNGVRSAIAAGLAVIQVPDLVRPSPDVEALGHSIVDSLSEARAVVQDWIQGS